MMRSRGMGPRTATLRLADTTTLQTSRPGTGRSAARGLGEAFAATGTGPDTCTRRGPVPFGALYAGMALQCILGVENMGLEPLIAEGAARVKPLLQSARSRHAARRAWRSSPRSCKKLAPVRGAYGRRQHLLDLGCDPLDRVLLSLPGEVERQAVLPVVHAPQQLVGSDGADLGDRQERLDAAREPPHGCKGLNGVPARKEALRLDIFTAARGESHPKVWDAVRPGTGPAQLQGAGGGIHHAGRMHLGGRRHTLLD